MVGLRWPPPPVLESSSVIMSHKASPPPPPGREAHHQMLRWRLYGRGNNFCRTKGIDHSASVSKAIFLMQHGQCWFQAGLWGGDGGWGCGFKEGGGGGGGVLMDSAMGEYLLVLLPKGWLPWLMTKMSRAGVVKLRP